ncbi:single-stranded DNA-binding protein [Bacillus phage SP-15]|uniref:Single-stranded DNA-binding protein n=1 Tax=Bacillus phage SP-15 TaxID=1792032 RepID=A0A127AWI1_9CAUD|nr:single-stranded DNA-binding protein [Bacillus phage SP-15]AMM44943.1 single-stranded DNA-binding protein [Bacillus phage SP-15]
MFNVTIIIGRLTKNPSYKYFEKSKSHRCTFKVAVPKGWFSSEADFIPIVVWGKDAVKCRDNLSKGNWIALQGKLSSRNYKNAQNMTVYVVEVEAKEVFFIDRGKSKDDKGPDLSQLPFANLDTSQFKFALEESSDTE